MLQPENDNLQTHNIDVTLPETYRHTAEELLEKVRRQSDASDRSGGSCRGDAPQLSTGAARSLVKAAHGRRQRSRSNGKKEPVRASHSSAVPSAQAAEAVPQDVLSETADAAPIQRNDTEYTMEEVAEHNTVDDCWLVADGVVYDVTSFLSEHPAGVAAIMRHAGQESSEDFQFHSQNAQKLWREYKVGTIKGYKRGCIIM